jgi:hypothetical protein
VHLFKVNSKTEEKSSQILHTLKMELRKLVDERSISGEEEKSHFFWTAAAKEMIIQWRSLIVIKVNVIIELMLSLS